MVFTEHGMLASKGSCYDLKYLVALGSEIVSDCNIPTIDMLVYLSGKNYGPGCVWGGSSGCYMVTLHISTLIYCSSCNNDDDENNNNLVTT